MESGDDTQKRGTDPLAKWMVKELNVNLNGVTKRISAIVAIMKSLLAGFTINQNLRILRAHCLREFPCIHHIDEW